MLMTPTEESNEMKKNRTRSVRLFLAALLVGGACDSNGCGTPVACGTPCEQCIAACQQNSGVSVDACRAGECAPICRAEAGR